MCLYSHFEGYGQPIQQDFTNYISISDGQFKDGNTPFYPVCVNYLVEYPCDMSNNNPVYYISPLFRYSGIKRSHNDTYLYGRVIDTTNHWGYGDDGLTERDSAGIKLDNDLSKMDSLGFNVVRIAPTMLWNNTSPYIPTGSYQKYFELTDSLIAKCTEKGLRVILVLGDRRQCYEQFDKYCVYLDSVTRHYSTNKAVMAYVVYMEPNWKWDNASENDKLMISNWSRKWYYLIKKNAPNQLVTYGLDGVGNVLFWDPSALTYDFLTMHFYHASNDPDSSSMALHTSLRWMHENVDDVWVLGETGFAGTSVDSCGGSPISGSEADQLQYINFSIWMSLGCGCKGYAWWQYQDVHWETCFENHLGLMTCYPNENPKSENFPFHVFSSHYIPAYLCSEPQHYRNFYGYGDNFSGVVLDQNSNPIKDAYVAAWSTSNKSIYSTFTDSQGQYTIHTPQDTTISLVWISKNGYTDKSFFHVGNTFENATLKRINYNKWKKNWTNENYPAVGDTIVVRSQDTVLVGNFIGDEADEMLVIKIDSQTATMYRFDVNHWELMWEGSLRNWFFSVNDKFYVGDFSGDGYDDLLCVQNVSNAQASIFTYNPFLPKIPWSIFWTNSGNGNIGNWNFIPGDILLPGYFNDTTRCSLMCIRNKERQKEALCQQWSSGSWNTTWVATSSILRDKYIGDWHIGEFDQYYVGDFSGDGIDELFCVQIIGGTTDNMRLMQYNNAWNTLWTNNGQSEGVGIYPYRNRLIVGNFDTDAADEILGVGSWATKFDLNTNNQWDWSWSTYESGRLSDWAVNPSHRIFFMKTITDVPDYLFVYRGIPRIDFRFDGYSFDP